MPQDGVNIFIGNLDDRAGLDDLEDFFHDYKGQFMSINIKKGFGFIKFYEKEDALRCMDRMNHRLCYGRKVNLELGDRDKKGGGGRGGGRDNRDRGRSRSRSRDRYNDRYNDRDRNSRDNYNNRDRNRSRSRDRFDRNDRRSPPRDNYRSQRDNYRGRSRTPDRDPRDSYRGQNSRDSRDNHRDNRDNRDHRDNSREVTGHAYASSNLPRHMGKIRDRGYEDRGRNQRRRTYRTKFALILKNLHDEVNWKDLDREAMTGAGVQMTFGDANKIVPNEG